MEERGWSMRELGRRAGVSNALVSLVVNEQAAASAEFCIKVADAFGWPKEETLRLAGILDPLPPEVADEQDMIRAYRAIAPELRQVALDLLRDLAAVRELPEESGSPSLAVRRLRRIEEEVSQDTLEEFTRIFEYLVDLRTKRELAKENA